MVLGSNSFRSDGRARQARRRRDAVATVDSNTSADSAPVSAWILGRSIGGRRAVGEPAHLGPLRARRRVRPDPQQLRLPAAHYSVSGGDAGDDDHHVIRTEDPGRLGCAELPVHVDDMRTSARSHVQHEYGIWGAKRRRGRISADFLAGSRQGHASGDRRSTACWPAAGHRGHRAGPEYDDAATWRAHRWRQRDRCIGPVGRRARIECRR